ncbi:MAG: superoxide dismutase family protein [Coxiellaceae bacterium]|nr:superoxide dismutase family protein [Coxiellaceae bacterium]
MYQVSRSGKGRYIGVIIAKDTRHGLLFVPRLHGLTPGYHGFHLHQNPSCKNYGKAAGPHWDPTDTKRHRGPYRHGHKGDLPFLYVNKAGFAKHAVIAPHLKLSDLKGHALIIHQGGDNYTDHPENGGGGARVACGVIDF